MKHSHILLLLIWMLTIACDDPVANQPDFVADIAVYTDLGSWDESVIATFASVAAAGYSAESISLEGILSDSLDRYRMILFPGGDPREISTGLGPVGRMNIESYVASGGGFMGFGGGAVIADSSTGFWPGVGLFAGEAIWPVETIATPPLYVMTPINLVASTHPIGRNGSSHYQTLYYGGPKFSYAPNEYIDLLYNYAVDGTPAAIAFSYMQGRVFLTGFQPEFEENSERDGTDFGSELVDNDSEWDIIERAVGFCLQESDYLH